MENKDRKHYEIALLLITFGVGAVLASRYLKAQELALGMMTDEQPPQELLRDAEKWQEWCLKQEAACQ